MKKKLIFTDYVKKIGELMQEISRLARSSDKVQDELFSSLEILQSTTGGKIFLLFLDVSLQFFSRLLPILLSRNSPSAAVQFNQNRIAKINDYIQIHFDKELKEKEVADFIGMSTGHFSHYFNKAFQCSFNVYLNRRKVNFATKLLKETDFQIIDICYRCGFSSPNQLNRAFKKELKMTPSEYRFTVSD